MWAGTEGRSCGGIDSRWWLLCSLLECSGQPQRQLNTCRLTVNEVAIGSPQHIVNQHCVSLLHCRAAADHQLLDPHPIGCLEKLRKRFVCRDANSMAQVLPGWLLILRCRGGCFSPCPPHLLGLQGQGRSSHQRRVQQTQQGGEQLPQPLLLLTAAAGGAVSSLLRQSRPPEPQSGLLLLLFLLLCWCPRGWRCPPQCSVMSCPVINGTAACLPTATIQAWKNGLAPGG